MAATDVYEVSFNEDGSATVLARMTARDGSGSATGVAGEGNWLEQADLASITCSVFDLTSSTPGTAIVTPTVTISSAILDTPVTATTIWCRDTVGYNFIHDLPVTAFPTGGNLYRVEYKFTTTGGSVGWLLLQGIATKVYTS